MSDPTPTTEPAPQPRTVEVPPEPPPVILKGFWARSATVSAILSTYETAMFLARPAMEAVAWLGVGGTAVLHGLGLLWLAAIGVTRTNPSARP